MPPSQWLFQCVFVQLAEKDDSQLFQCVFVQLAEKDDSQLIHIVLLNRHFM